MPKRKHIERELNAAEKTSLATAREARNKRNLQTERDALQKYNQASTPFGFDPSVKDRAAQQDALKPYKWVVVEALWMAAVMLPEDTAERNRRDSFGRTVKEAVRIVKLRAFRRAREKKLGTTKAPASVTQRHFICVREDYAAKKNLKVVA